MHHTLGLKKKLAFARFMHLLVMYIIAMLFFLCSNLPHSWWILAMTLAISSNIEPGLMLGNSIKRSKGSFVSLLLLPVLLYVLHINYRFIPVVLIIALIGFNVASLNFRRYEITVFFNTIAIIILLAQTSYVGSPEGPLEAVINRGISIIIAIMIIVCGDYFLFNSYRYSQKIYLLHQMMIYDLFNNSVQKIRDAAEKNANVTLLMKKLRTNTNDVYKLISVSSENLKTDLSVSDEMKRQVDAFQDLIWELRRVTFALCFSELVLKSQSMSAIHMQRFQELIINIREKFISLVQQPEQRNASR